MQVVLAIAAEGEVASAFSPTTHKALLAMSIFRSKRVGANGKDHIQAFYLIGPVKSSAGTYEVVDDVVFTREPGDRPWEPFRHRQPKYVGADAKPELMPWQRQPAQSPGSKLRQGLRPQLKASEPKRAPKLKPVKLTAGHTHDEILQELMRELGDGGQVIDRRELRRQFIARLPDEYFKPVVPVTSALDRAIECGLLKSNNGNPN